MLKQKEVKETVSDGHYHIGVGVVGLLLVGGMSYLLVLLITSLKTDSA